LFLITPRGNEFRIFGILVLRMVYKGTAKALLDKFGVREGDWIAITAAEGLVKGTLMPRAESGDDSHLIIKLANGYNVGVEIDGSEEIKKLESFQKIGSFQKKQAAFKQGKPLLAIIHTGGTIASRVDYRTGGVISAFTPDELLHLFPDLDKITNLDAVQASNMFSEDVEPGHWRAWARQAVKEIESGANGIVITHGTDTMHVSSAALSFMLQNLPIPILFVGAQRSSDRGSSDAEMNLMTGAHFAIGADFAGVGLCMHAKTGEDYNYVHEGTKVRKMHTSRRDAFRSINALPWARVWRDGRVEFLREKHPTRDASRVPVLREAMEDKVALVKSFTGMPPEIFSFYAERGYRGIVLEGTGLGHIPLNEHDEFTRRHPEHLGRLRDFCERGGVAVMTSSCLYGRINMNVYSTGRDLLRAGVVPGADMTPETAFVKLKWVLGQTRDAERAKAMMLENYAGEISERTEARAYIDQFIDNDAEEFAKSFKPKKE
jgi:glutamyl-tRNA(Gln) amidotransferase subunit D